MAQDDDAVERLSLRRDDALAADVPPAALWRAAFGSAVSVRHWGEDTVVYVQESAATHWLGPEASAVFLALRSSQEPRSVEDLCLALTPQQAADDHAALQALLMQLRSLGLASTETLAPR